MLDRWGFPIPEAPTRPIADEDLPPMLRKRGPGSPRDLKLIAKLREMQEKQLPGQTYTLDQIGDFCGVSERHIKLIEAKALRKLRSFVPHELTEFLNRKHATPIEISPR